MQRALHPPSQAGYQNKVCPGASAASASSCSRRGPGSGEPLHKAWAGWPRGSHCAVGQLEACYPGCCAWGISNTFKGQVLQEPSLDRQLNTFSLQGRIELWGREHLWTPSFLTPTGKADRLSSLSLGLAWETADAPCPLTLKILSLQVPVLGAL